MQTSGKGMGAFYYSEAIEKDTKYRQDYVDGIQLFLQKKEIGRGQAKKVVYQSPGVYGRTRNVS